MIWGGKEQRGTERLVYVHFAWFPRLMDDGRWIWLQEWRRLRIPFKKCLGVETIWVSEVVE